MTAKKRGIRLKALDDDDEGLKELFESASERLVGRGREAVPAEVPEVVARAVEQAVGGKRPPVEVIRCMRKELEATLALLDADLPPQESDGQQRLQFEFPEE